MLENPTEMKRGADSAAEGGAVAGRLELVSMGWAAGLDPELRDASGVNGIPEVVEAALEATAKLVPLGSELMVNGEVQSLVVIGVDGRAREDRADELAEGGVVTLKALRDDSLDPDSAAEGALAPTDKACMAAFTRLQKLR